MIGKGLNIGFQSLFWLLLLLHLAPLKHLYAEIADQKKCIALACEETLRIKALPQRAYLRTLDGQMIPLDQLFHTCEAMFPWCCLFDKFYYWSSEVMEFSLPTPDGQVTYTARCYRNSLSKHCPEMSDALKTHGDVAEYYNQNGRFIGLGVYMGNGAYCPLPFARPAD